MTPSRWYRRMVTLAVCVLAYCYVLHEISTSWKMFAGLLWGLAFVIAAVWIPCETWYYKQKRQHIKRCKFRMDKPEFGGYPEDDPREDR